MVMVLQLVQQILVQVEQVNLLSKMQQITRQHYMLQLVAEVMPSMLIILMQLIHLLLFRRYQILLE